MKLYQYKNYEEYKQAQTKANIQKIVNVWINESTVNKIKSFFVSECKDILCHGVRNAKEIVFFQKHFTKANVIGTEISTTASKFRNVVEWDFHNIKEEWKDKFDIVYSNSWDHSYDPVKSLTTWKEQLKEKGLMFIEVGITEKDNKSTITDPLEINDDEIKNLLSENSLTLQDTFITSALKNGTKAKVYVIKK